MVALLAVALLQEEFDLYRHVSSANVEILVDGRLSGSGWVAASDGHVVTAAHVVHGKKEKLEARLPSGVRQKLSRVAVDLGHDIALLRLPERDKPWPALEVAPKTPRPGAEVFVFGSPQFRHRLLLSGRIARPEPAYEYLSDLECAVRVTYVSGAAPSGTSGGCWVDSKGRVVANQSGGVYIHGHSTGVQFAAPRDAIDRLVRTRKSAVTVDAGLVVEELSEHTREGLKEFPRSIRGVLGVICFKDGPAAKAGLTPRFVVVKASGTPVETRDDFYSVIRGGKPDDKIRLEIHRGGKTEEVVVRLRRLEP